jgi:POT family proton-dependent oligopeptide transporter
MDAAIGAVGAAVILLLRKPLIRELDGAPEVPG